METLILHGWTTKIDKWQPFLKQLASLQPKLLKVPRLTEKITEQSSPSGKPWTLDDYVSWLKEEVGQKKVILIGHSNGGRIAIAFTAKYPEKVEKLILIDSAGIYRNELSFKLKKLIFKSIAKVGKKLTKSESLRNLLYKLTGESDYNNADSIQKQTMINLISVDLTPELKKINTPTLIIWGENDKATPLSDGKLMHRLIPNSHLHIIKDARHAPQFTNCEEVGKVIYEYL